MQRFHLRLLENDRRALHQFNGDCEATAHAYLRKIAASVALNMLPPKGACLLPLQVFTEAGPPLMRPVFPEPAGAADDYMELLQDLDAALGKIFRGRRRYRNMLIFKLSFFYGFSSEDIARVMGLKISSRHAIEQFMHRTRAKLARQLRARNGN